MFQFPQFPLPALCVQAGVTSLMECGVSPFRNPRIKTYSAVPRGLSQPITSFVGRSRQGIHRWPFIACGLTLNKIIKHGWSSPKTRPARIDARARYAILKKRRKEPANTNSRHEAGRSVSISSLKAEETKCVSDCRNSQTSTCVN